MGYVKKEFNGNYLEWYNVIGAHGESNVEDLPSYSNIENDVNLK